MTGWEIAALIYLVIGLILAAVLWQVLHGEACSHGSEYTCDDCDENQDVVEMVQSGLREPAIRFLVAGALTAFLAVMVLAWPGMLAWAITLQSRRRQS